MNNNQTLTNIYKNTVSIEEVFKHFTPEMERQVEAEIKFYSMLVELRKFRKERGLTQAQLAKQAGLPRTTITKIESGTYNPTINTLMSIAAAMDKKLEISFV